MMLFFITVSGRTLPLHIDAGLPVKEVKNIKQTMINKKGRVKEHNNMER